MSHISRFALLLVLAVAPLAGCSPEEPDAPSPKPGPVVLPAPLALVRVEWDADAPADDLGAQGERHGRSHKEEIQRLVAAAQPDEQAREHARREALHLPPARHHELERLARAADVPFDALLAVQLEPPPPGVHGASVVALGRATSMGQVLHGASVPARAGARPMWFAGRPGSTLGVLLLGHVGGVGGWAGLNEARLSVSVDEFERLPGNEPRFPSVLIARDILERARTLDEAAVFARSYAQTHGVRIAIADGGRLDARVVERRGADANVRRPHEHVLLAVDPTAPPSCFDGACDMDVPRADLKAAARYEVLQAYLETTHGHVRAPDLGTTLRRPAPHGTLACVFEPQLAAARFADGDGEATVSLDDLASPPGARARPAPRPPVEGAGDVKVRLKSLKMGEVTLSEVEFDSPAPSGFAVNDRVRAVYYEPPQPKGAVVVLPAWKESNLVGQGVLAIALAKKGWAALVMPLPYQVDRALDGFSSGEMTLSADLARTRQAFLQGAADVARATWWLESRGHATSRIGVLGTSLGGHVAALAFAAYPERLASGVFLLAGGDVSTALLEHNRVTGRIRKVLLEKGVTPEEALPLIRGIDGVAWADPAQRAKVLLIGAKLDDVVPPENVRALADAFGGARTEWVEGDHFGILAQLTKAMAWVVDHLEQTLGAS